MVLQSEKLLVRFQYTFHLNLYPQLSSIGILLKSLEFFWFYKIAGELNFEFDIIFKLYGYYFTHNNFLLAFNCCTEVNFIRLEFSNNILPNFCGISTW